MGEASLRESGEAVSYEGGRVIRERGKRKIKVHKHTNPRMATVKVSLSVPSSGGPNGVEKVVSEVELGLDEAREVRKALGELLEEA